VISAPDGGAEASSFWADVLAAATILATDPQAFGGAIVRARAGPVRDTWLARFASRLAPGTPVLRLPAHTDEERLHGGLDLTATLAAGRPIAARGLIERARGGVLIAPMAERMAPTIAAALAGAMDLGTLSVIALDEGVDDERVGDVLAERLAFRVELDDVRPSEALFPTSADLIRSDAGTYAEDVDQAISDNAPSGAMGPGVRRDAAARAETSDPIATVSTVAAALGIGSPRAPLFALRAARAAAALRGRAAPEDDDLALAVRLVLAPRAMRLPERQAAEEPADQTAYEAGAEPPDQEVSADRPANGDADGDATADPPLTDRLIETVRATLPDHILANLGEGVSRAPAAGKGAGAKRASAKSGRPVGTRRGDPRGGNRLALVATLTAAAPWQPLRRKSANGTATDPARFLVTPDDFRIRRFEERREATTIFVVDASGSAAFERLGEAKGAVELILAEAYIARAQAALIAFRGASAETLLPPTRSLARAKRSLGELVGGGGTPLATGVEAAHSMAEAERARGRTPFIVFLTDARANVGRDGKGGRAAAEVDALAAAARLRASRIGAVVIDTATRPGPAGANFAAAMGARYAPLPRAGAAAVAGAVRAMMPV